MTDAPPALDRLARLGDAIRQEFVRNRRVLSFGEYLELVSKDPTRQLRSAAQMLVGAFDHFGSVPVTYPWGTTRRFNLFDAPWADGNGKLYGHEVIQERMYQALRSFVQDGSAGKVVLLHGPNGSAKSTFLRCLGRGLEHYTTLDEGACYRFSWIFPSQKSSKGGIGFGGSGQATVDAAESFATLPDDSIDARLPDELRDHPLLLIPAAERLAFMNSTLASQPDGANFVISDYLRHGTLSAKNRTVYEALLTSYQGDYLKVLRHVRVERFYISQHYRVGWVTVEPQLSVDATERQVTADRTMTALPPSLQSVALFDYGGEVVGANRGLIEFDDLLKRPLEAFKYLLTTVERGALSMATATLLLDLVFSGSCNDIHLSAFREVPDFQSFKGRIELIRVPYILDVRHEESLYKVRLTEAAGPRHVAPHTAFVLARWAVLSRMRRPQIDRYPVAIAEVIGKLTPAAKADLYATGRAPDGVTPEQARELRTLTPTLYHESDGYPIYEGRIGASPREMQSVLLAAIGSSRTTYVSPLVVLDEIGELCKQIAVYEFLRQEVQPNGFHDHRGLIDVVRGELMQKIDDEVRSALGLVDEAEYTRVFDRYITHAIHSVRKEKVRATPSGRLEDPDESMMREVESTLGVIADASPPPPGAAPSADAFRSGLIAKIGAWSLDHKGERPVMAEVFPELVTRLRESFYARSHAEVAKGINDLLAFLTDQRGRMSAESVARCERAEEMLIARYGYSRDSARDLVGALRSTRYRS